MGDGVEMGGFAGYRRVRIECRGGIRETSCSVRNSYDGVYGSCFGSFDWSENFSGAGETGSWFLIGC